MKPRVGDVINDDKDREWVVFSVANAEDAIEEARPTQRAGEASRIAAAAGCDWREQYWKAMVRRKNGFGTKVVDSIEFGMKKMELEQGHIEVEI